VFRVTRLAGPADREARSWRPSTSRSKLRSTTSATLDRPVPLEYAKGNDLSRTSSTAVARRWQVSAEPVGR
jgi:hypothetical protein